MTLLGTPQRPRLAVWFATISGIVLLVVLVVCVVLALQTRAAVCSFKTDLEGRVVANEQFLKMSDAERVRAYGPALAKTPDAFVVSQIASQKATLASFVRLHC